MEYISPSSYATYLTAPSNFYFRYIKKVPITFIPTAPMLLGTLFDGFVKSYLCKQLYGPSSDYKKYRNDDEVSGRSDADEIIEAAQFVFHEYIKQGCFNYLLKEMEHSASPPKFEFELHNVVDGIPLKGYPDLYFTTREGILVIYDWKVNGFYGKSTTSPVKGYVHCTPKGQAHKDCTPYDYAGLRVSDDPIAKAEWMNQLLIYSWLLGNPVGETECILGIDQLVCNPPDIRVARHRCRPEQGGYSLQLWGGLTSMWQKVNSESWVKNQDKLYGATADAFIKALSSPDQQEAQLAAWIWDISAEPYRGLPAP